LSNGFSTARQQMATQESTASERSPKKEVNGGQKKVAVRSHVESGFARGTISSYFGQSRQTGAKQTASNAPFLVNRQTVEGRSQDGEDGIDRLPPSQDILQPTVPENLSDHRIRPPRPRPTAGPSKRLEHTWLSALPNPAANPPSIASQPKCGNNFENTEMRTKAESEEIKRSQGSLDSIESSTTIRQAGPANGRKTLGIRRSMNGWADRMSRANNKNA
jgi:DNA helicase-2/ATP-dependent DNA helicase PcrA